MRLSGLGMRQRRFPFREPKVADNTWAEIIAADPEKYRGLSLRLALLALHRAGRAHDQAACPLCQENNI